MILGIVARIAAYLVVAYLLLCLVDWIAAWWRDAPPNRDVDTDDWGGGA